MARLVLGVQPVREAIRAHGPALERVLVEESDSPTLGALCRFAEGRGVAVERVRRAELDRRSEGGRHQGAAAIAPDLRLWQLDAIPLDERSVVVALDGIVDPQNFGAVIRSAVALGANAIVWPESGSAPLTPATFRASAGAVEHATLCRVRSLADAVARLEARGLTTVALDAQGAVDLGDIDLRGACAIVIGAEDKGVHRAVRRACRHVARLPMRGPLGSLNASVAGGIALYEAQRQRGSPAGR